MPRCLDDRLISLMYLEWVDDMDPDEKDSAIKDFYA